MPISSISVGKPKEAYHPNTLKAGLAEFISVQIYVFIVEGSGMAFAKVTDGGVATPTGLVYAAIAQAFAFVVAVSVSANISGGHVNPAVTFGTFVGGNISLLKGLVYWIAQFGGASVACLLVKFATGMKTPDFALTTDVSIWNRLLLEIVMTFGLVYTVYATAVDPKKGNIGIIGPIAIGFILGANILVGGAFTGATMNPALSSGSALINWRWENHWVYWVGPLIGGGIAGLVYETVFIGFGNHEPAAAEYQRLSAA